MAKVTKAEVLAAPTRAALIALADSNWPDCVDCIECKRCRTCTTCERCIECRNCTACIECREVTNGTDCRGCSNLTNATDCTNCHGLDSNPAQKLHGCENCTLVERSFYVSNETGTEANPIRNRFMHIQLTAAEFDALWALPLG